MNRLFDLSGKVAIVTGGAGLIGSAISEALSEYGSTVVVADQAIDEAFGIDQSLNSEYVDVDVTDEQSVQDLIQSVRENHEKIDVLFNCAYPRNENYGQKYENVGIDDWRENIDLHLNSYYLTTRAASLEMIKQGQGGSIVNVASIYGSQAPDFSVYEGTEMTSPVEYSAIKGGILNMTRYLASYLGNEGIRVNAISPGGVFDEQNPRFVEAYERRTPLGRMATPDDFKGPAVFLASDASAYVTGHDLRVDGGWTIC